MTETEDTLIAKILRDYSHPLVIAFTELLKLRYEKHKESLVVALDPIEQGKALECRQICALLKTDVRSKTVHNEIEI